MNGQQRVAVVTGGSRGIGRAAAITLGSRGYAVAVGFAGSADAANQVVETITAAGGRAISVQADVADENAVAAAFDSAEKEFGGVDVVVNSAGRMGLSPIADLDLAVLDDLYRTNIRGTFVVARRPHGACAPGAPSSICPPRWWACSSPSTAPTPPAREPSRR